MRRALGKGLSQLLGEEVGTAPNELPIESIVTNETQPRTKFDENALKELADSMEVHGILQPLLVRPIGDGRYAIIAGERRFRAAQIAGLRSVPVQIRTATDRTTLELALIENVQREDITPVEAARAYRRLVDEFGLTQDQVAARVGKARATVANSIRLLKLPTEILDGLESGSISEGHARALLQVTDPALQLALYRKVVEKGLNVREVERAAQESPRARREGKKKSKGLPEWKPLEDGMTAFFSSPVKLQKSGTGGRIVIDFYSEDDLERILEVLGIRL